jgi:PIN domain nuclease of toxin-antitoxin system
MPGVLADTHTILWYLTADARISRFAIAALDDATSAGDSIFVSAITMVEIHYLVEKGRLSAGDQRIVIEAVDDVRNPVRLVPVDRSVIDALGQVNRNEVPDMPDRIIAATALALGVPLLSRDHKIRASQVQTIW